MPSAYMGRTVATRNLARDGRAHYAKAMLNALFMLAAVQAAPPATGMRVEELSNGQFRITVTRRGANARPAALADAMIRVEVEIGREARRRCQGRGGAVPIDRGAINVMADNRWETIQTFACRTPPAPAATPPSGG